MRKHKPKPCAEAGLRPGVFHSRSQQIYLPALAKLRTNNRVTNSRCATLTGGHSRAATGIHQLEVTVGEEKLVQLLLESARAHVRMELVPGGEVLAGLFVYSTLADISMDGVSNRLSVQIPMCQS